MISIHPADEKDRSWMLEVIRGWGADFIVTRGRKVYAAELPAFIAETSGSSDSCPVRLRRTHICRGSLATSPGGFEANPPYKIAPDRRRLGLVTYEIIGDLCEVVTLDAFTQFSGIGTALMQRVIEAARNAGCRRVWLITTNDNVDAIRFYQKRGFTIAAVHVGAIEHSRKLKPSIAMIGNYGIPIRDEIELEMVFK